MASSHINPFSGPSLQYAKRSGALKFSASITMQLPDPSRLFISAANTPTTRVMKKITFSLLLIVIALPSFSANTWYSTGIDSDWDNAESWSLDPVLISQSGIPEAGDDVVIRHPLTQILEGAYHHSGSIMIESEGVLEVISLEGNPQYIFSGESFKNFGILMTNLPVVIRSKNQLAATEFWMEEGSQALLGSALSFVGKVNAHFINGSCGALIVKGALTVTGINIHFYGVGGWIVENGYRVFNKNNVELIDPVKRDQALASYMESGLSLYTDMNMCALDQRGLEGTWLPITEINLDTEDRSNVLGMFPNPQANGMSIQIDGTGFEMEESVFVEVRTMMGQQILSQLSVADENGDIQISANWTLEPGQYFVTVRGVSHRATQRMMRQ